VGCAGTDVADVGYLLPDFLFYGYQASRVEEQTAADVA
jgi:hypothetical protein